MGVVIAFTNLVLVHAPSRDTDTDKRQHKRSRDARKTTLYNVQHQGDFKKMQLWSLWKVKVEHKVKVKEKDYVEQKKMLL